MRDDIVGMLKNAIDHGGNPQRVAQSLINSGYPMKDVKEAYDFVVANNPNLQQSQETSQNQPQSSQVKQQSQSQQVMQQNKSEIIQVQSLQQSPQAPPKMQMPQAPQYRAPQTTMPPANFTRPKPLPSQKINPPGVGKILALILVLLLLVLALISVIVFKEDILDLLSL